MVAAIGSSYAGYSASIRTKPSGSLELDLQKYKAQLADWCQCSSAKTPEGKAKIQELTAKVHEIEAHIAKTRSSDQSAPSSKSADTPNTGIVNTASTAASETVGSLVNVLA